jgi:chromobox protein 1
VTDDFSSGAKAVLEAYHASIGGRPSPRKKASAKKSSTKEKTTTSRSSKRPTDVTEHSTPVSSKKQRSSRSDPDSQALPLGTWEEDVTVNAIVQKTVAGATDQSENVTATLQGLVLWSSTGRKTEHDMEVLRQKCPQRLLDYYEAHL